MPKLRRIGLLASVALFASLAQSGALSSAEGWLTEPERQFFIALGSDVRVAGKLHKRAAAPTEPPKIAQRAPEPLSRRIQAIADALAQMDVTPQERARLKELVKQGEAAMHEAMGQGLVESLLGEDTFDSAVNATDRVMREGSVQKAWDLQRRWLERGLAAREAADANLAEILSIPDECFRLRGGATRG
jgi:hypothetical protein